MKVRLNVCVCACVCVRESEKERRSERVMKGERVGKNRKRERV